MTKRYNSLHMVTGCILALIVGILSLFSYAQNLPSTSQSMVKPTLTGELTQGSLIRGSAAPNTRVWLNGDEIAVDAAGNFVFGFGRDADTDHTLEWQHIGEAHSHEDQKLDKQAIALNISEREYDIQRIEGVAQKYVSPPDAVLARISDDNRAIAKARATSSRLKDYLGDFVMPAKGRISGVYGSQRVFNGEPRRPHYGLDIANAVGSPVIAPLGGVITLAHHDMYYSGGTIIMDHGFGVSSTFIHLSKLHVSEEKRVEQGELIGEIGATGRVTGPHLDWRINWFSERLDPALVIEIKPAK